MTPLLYKARLITVFFAFVFVYFIVIGNLYRVQIQQNLFFKQLGQQQYKVTIIKTPARAEIYDRSAIQPLAMNKESLSAFIIPQQLEDTIAVKKFLAKNFPQAADRLEKNMHTHFMYIKRRLSSAQIALIQKDALNDIKLLKEPSRYYPIESVGPLVGITDIDNQGLFGIELMCNQQLAGKPSTFMLEKDARSGHFYFKYETKIKGSIGQSVSLTLDSNLQFLVHEELKEAVVQFGSQEGSALIVDGTTGEILACATYPDFDPNCTESLDVEKTKNRPMVDAYELGSVIKIFLALAALEEKIVTPEELIDCENSISYILNGIKFTTWKAHGLISFTEVIEGSNNIGTAKVALRLGPQLYNHYRQLGFGKKIGIFPAESNGFINPPATWSKASPISLSFGYEISCTLLQLAQAVTVLTNNGALIKPTLIKSENKNKQNPSLYHPNTILNMREILKKTAAKWQIPGFTIMGKTGTARLLTQGKYDPGRLIFTFAGIVEQDKYKRIIVTCLKETTQKNPFASTTAAPLFEKLVRKMIIHDKLVY
jgi:cell division protein FtsI (penicillin-binding protein 3)